MQAFEQALLAKSRNTVIPEEKDYFGQLMGEWDFDWMDRNHPRTVKGEWIFSWILEGRAVQDVFICPSRETRAENPQPDGEYGTTLRIYNPESRAWDIAYCWTGRVTKLEARREGEKIVLTNTANPSEKWVFSEMTESTFHWQNVTVQKDGSWHINADLYAKRRK